MQRIEPAARLINGFANIIGRILRFELILILERIVPLSIRHRTRVEPHINQIQDAAHLAAAFRTGITNFVNIWTMQIEIAQIASNFFG